MSNVQQITKSCHRQAGRTRILYLGIAMAMALPELVLAGVAVRGPRGGGAAVSRGHHHGYHRGAASVHGTARRTSRRTTRRTMRRLYTLPRGYTTAVVAGATYYVVEGVYYKPYYEGTKVVYVEVEL